jgi:hypothetical protein
LERREAAKLAQRLLGEGIELVDATVCVVSAEAAADDQLDTLIAVSRLVVSAETLASGHFGCSSCERPLDLTDPDARGRLTLHSASLNFRDDGRPVIIESAVRAFPSGEYVCVCGHREEFGIADFPNAEP